MSTFNNTNNQKTKFYKQKYNLNSMKRFTITTFPLENKTIFLRMDYNVPLEKGKIKDNTKYHIYFVSSYNKKYSSIISGRREIYFKKNHLHKNNLLKVPYRSSKFTSENLFIYIPRNTKKFIDIYAKNY